MKSKVCLQLCVFCKLNRIFQPEELLFIKKLESSFMDWAGSRWMFYFSFSGAKNFYYDASGTFQIKSFSNNELPLMRKQNNQIRLREESRVSSSRHWISGKNGEHVIESIISRREREKDYEENQ